MLAVLLEDNTIRACFNVILVLLWSISMAGLWGSIMVLFFVTVIDPKRKLWSFPISIVYTFIHIGLSIVHIATRSRILDVLVVRGPLSQAFIGFYAAARTKWKLRKETKDDSVKDVEQGKEN